MSHLKKSGCKIIALDDQLSQVIFVIDMRVESRRAVCDVKVYKFKFHVSIDGLGGFKR